MKGLRLIAVLIAGISINSFAADCESNLKVEGNFLKGKVYKTNGAVEGVDTTAAFANVYKYLVKDGWKIQASDKEIGSITAGQEVSYGEGKSAPLNVLVEKADAAVNVSISFATSGGTMASKDTITKQFCAIIAEAGKK